MLDFRIQMYYLCNGNKGNVAFIKYTEIMETITINTGTKLAIGYLFSISIPNGVKLMCAKNRQIIITVAGDMHDLHAFTLRGANITNEKRMFDVFGGEALQTAIKDIY